MNIDQATRGCIVQAIENLQLASDAEQFRLNQLARTQFPAGKLLAVGRCVDTLERCSRDLLALLDPPPSVADPKPARLLSRPARHDDIAA